MKINITRSNLGFKAIPAFLLIFMLYSSSAFGQTTTMYSENFNSYTTRQNAGTTFGTSSGYWSSGEPAPPGSQNAILESTVGSGGSSFALWFVTGSSGTFGSGTIFSRTQTNTLNAQRYRFTYTMYTDNCDGDPGCSGTQSSFTTRVTGSSNVYNNNDGILPCRSATNRTSGWINTNSTTTTFAVLVSGGSSLCNDFWIDNVQIECFNPVISSQPAGATYCLNASASALSVTATDAGTYRWYRNTTSSTTGGTLVQSSSTTTHLSTTSTYTPSTTASGTYYYYVVINEGTPCSVTSDVVAVTVSADTDGDGVSDLCDLDDDNDGILDADECNSTQRFVYTNFANAGGSGGTVNYPTGWILSPVGSGLNGISSNNSVAFTNNSTLQTLTHDGNLTGVHRSTDGRITVRARVEFIDVAGTSHQMNLTISYAGTTYATLSSTTGASTSGTVTYSNGASGNITRFTIGTSTGTTAFDIEIYLPLTVPATGAFLFTGDPTGRSVGTNTSDDVRLYTVSLQSCRDSDGDGNPDLLDLDSDNDGCPDAIEGDEKVKSSDLSANRISGTVDSDGVPILVNTGGAADIGSDQGQGTGVSTSATTNGCTDSDGDGVTDDLDLDDDNDGILDIDEGGCTSANISSLFTTTVANTLNAGTPVTFTNVGGFTGLDLTVSRVNVTGTPTVANGGAGGSIGFSLNAVEAGTLRFQFSGGTSKFVRSLSFDYDGNQIMNDACCQERQEITSTNGTVSYTLSAGHVVNVSSITNGYRFLGQSGVGNVFFTIDYPNLSSATFDFKDELIRSSGPGPYTQYLYDINVCVADDRDGDGIPDHLDLDSDNDGCLDAIEGGGNYSILDLTTASGTVAVGTGSVAPRGNFGTAVDANGVPISVGSSGQTVGESQTSNPATVGGTASSSQTIAPGATPAALTLTGSVGTIQWQSSTDGINFTDISGASSATYSPPALTTTTHYRAVQTTAGGCANSSNIIIITVSAPPAFCVDVNNAMLNYQMFDFDPVSSPNFVDTLGTGISGTKPLGVIDLRYYTPDNFLTGRSDFGLWTSTPTFRAGAGTVDAIATGGTTMGSTAAGPGVSSGITIAPSLPARTGDANGLYLGMATSGTDREYAVWATPFQVTTTTTFEVSFDWAEAGANTHSSGTVSAGPQFFINTTPTWSSTGMSYTYSTALDLYNGAGTQTWETEKTTFTLTPGTYYWGFTVFSNAAQGNVVIDGIKMTPLSQPDINATNVNQSVSGNVSTNDGTLLGTTYGTSPVLSSSPSGSTATLTMTSSGSYTFQANLPGIYIYNVSVCRSGACNCLTEKLTITVNDPDVTTNDPYANTDIGSGLQGNPVTLNTLANDAAGNVAGSLDPSSVTIVTGTAPDPTTQGSLTVDPATGNITFTPVAGFTGTVTYQYEVCDNTTPTPNCAIATQEVTILPTGSSNSVLAADDFDKTQGTTPATGSVLTNDSDPEGNTLTVAAQNTTIPGVGTFVLNTNGTYTFTAVKGYTGPASLVYQVCDNGSPTACTNATLYIMVEQPVVSQPDINATFVNTPVEGSVATNDDVPAGTTYGTSPTLSSSPSGSTPVLTMNSDGTYTFTADKPGVYEYLVPVCGPGVSSPCPTEKLTITVNDPDVTTNDPYANTDIGSGLQGNPVTLNTLANDAAGNLAGSLDPSSVTIVSGTAPDPTTEGSLTVDPATGNITFTPVAGFTGTVTYQYEVCDNTTPTPNCAIATQEVTILPTGSANSVLAADDFDKTQGTTPATGSVLTNDSDPEGNTLIVAAQNTTIPGVGTFVLNTNGTYTFTAVEGYTGPASLVYEVCDNVSPSACTEATLYILVEQPVITKPDVNATYVNTPVDGSVATNDDVPAGTTYGTSPTLNSSPSGSTPVLTMNSDGTYTFEADLPGVYEYLVPVCGPGVSSPCPTEKLTITVVDNNTTSQPPIANVDMGSGMQGNPVTLKTLANDQPATTLSSLDPTSVTIVSGTPNPTTQGSLAVDPVTGDITFTPVAGFTGTITYTYQVCDLSTPTPQCTSAEQIITIMPAGAANSTMAADDYVTIGNGSVATGNVLDNDSDPEGNSHTVTAQNTTITGKGTLVLNTNGTYTFTPDASYHGPVSFPYSVCDNGVPQACTHATLYFLVEDLAILPVSLVNFSSNCQNGNTILKWTTSDEINSSHFEVERSTDGRNWRSVGYVKAKGTSYTLQTYSYEDKEKSEGSQRFYRLKMTDSDGTYQKSKIVFSNCFTEVAFVVNVYPNPASEYAEIVAGESLGEFSLWTIDGRLLFRNNTEMNQYKLNMSDLLPGVYVLKVKGEIVKLIKE